MYIHVPVHVGKYVHVGTCTCTVPGLFQDWINARIERGDCSAYLRFVPKILLAVSIGVLDDVYKKIAVWLNNKGTCVSYQ